MTGTRARVLIAAGLVVLVANPLLIGWWEASMVRHLLGQVPLLILAGVLLAGVLPARRPGAPTSGTELVHAIAALLVAAICLGFWMLPRWLDAAIGQADVDALKVITLVFFAGLPLGWAWPRLGSLARSIVWAQVVSMFAALGVLYLSFPDRLCNNYLYDEQAVLGTGLLMLAGALMLIGAVAAFAGISLGARPHPISRVSQPA